MYHGIVSALSVSPERREEGADIYDVKAGDFCAQMELLKRQNDRAIITFDDGEMNNYEIALPILKELQLTAIFFIIVKRVGAQGYLGWEEIRKLIQAGMKVGSHGLTHEILTGLTDDQIKQELKASKMTLEANLGVPINDLSVPRGFCNDKIIQMAYAQGYKNVFISERPYHIKSPCIARVAVKGNWSLRRFQQALMGETPLNEIVGNFFKKSAKTILGGDGYNYMRKVLIKILR